MRNSSRYAVYYAPEIASYLADFGASWLGWDPERGEAVAHPAYADLPVPVSELTATPRKYGFHGTLKPPFKLTNGYTVSDLNDALVELAGQQQAFDIEAVNLHSIGGFLAITPTRHSAPLAALAENCVRQLDAFRASPGEAELTRRRSAKLSKAQDRNLTRWGYPYVLDEFRFHLTLTGKLAPEILEPVRERLQIELASILAKPLPIQEICLFREAQDGNFHIVKRYQLSA